MTVAESEVRASEERRAGETESEGTNRKKEIINGLTNWFDRYQVRLMRSVNARCVSIGLVLAPNNCSESGGEPDAMLDIHHPGIGIDPHHPQFHNSYGNMKFIIII